MEYRIVTVRIHAAIVFTILLGMSASTAQVRKTLTEAEAIRLAEQFVVENGYTDLPAMKDKAKLSYEGIDSSDPDVRLRERYNTLERKAYAVRGGNTTNHWTILFRYNANNEKYRRIVPDYEHHIKNAGRAVTMNADGSGIRMAHQDALFEGAKVIQIEGK
jgi:hypothetical protein